MTGPPESTLSAAGMKALLERKTHKSIEYVCCEAPPVKDLTALWRFLRAGGYVALSVSNCSYPPPHPNPFLFESRTDTACTGST